MVGGVCSTSTMLGRARGIRNTWSAHPHVPVALHPALGQLTHMQCQEETQMARLYEVFPSPPDPPSSARPSVIQLCLLASYVWRLTPLHQPC